MEEQAALAKWPLDVMLNYLKNFSTEQAIANTVYLRHLQQIRAGKRSIPASSSTPRECSAAFQWLQELAMDTSMTPLAGIALDEWHALTERVNSMSADIMAKDKILDQHIVALRSVAWAITDKVCGGFDDIVAEAKRVRAELKTRDAQFKAMLASYSDKCSALALDIANKTAELEACRQELSSCIDSHEGWNKQ